MKSKRTSRGAIRLLWAIVPVIGLIAATDPAGSAPRKQMLFGSEEHRARSIHLFPKWTGILRRYNAQRTRPRGTCRAGAAECRVVEWRSALDGLRGRSRRDQLRAVNRLVNRVRYAADDANYRVADYWAAPGEFFAKGGDCEDYAIAKYLSLKALGFPPGAMRILVLHDERRRTPHAVLIVSSGGVSYVLDNTTDEIVDASRIHHFRPIYSINEAFWWLHRRPAKDRDYSAIITAVSRQNKIRTTDR